MQLKYLVLLVKGLIFCNIFYFVTVQAIVGQKVKRAKEGDFPSNVAILNLENIEEKENNIFCGGVLISKTHVLTVAHCMEDVRLNETVIIIGSVDVRCGLPYYPIWFVNYNRWATYRRIHKEFRVNDIGIIKASGKKSRVWLSQSVPDIIVIGVLSSLKNPQLYGLTVKTAGWGMKENHRYSRVLRKVSLNVMTQSDCEDRVETLAAQRITIHTRHICTIADPFALMYYGDSGNPIYYKRKIVAIHKSTNPLEDQPLYPTKVNVHIGIDYYRVFILDILRTDIVWF